MSIASPTPYRSATTQHYDCASLGPSALAEILVNFDARNHISGTAEARVAKFCIRVEYMNTSSASLAMTDYALSCVVMVT